VRRALQTEAPNALPSVLGHALGLFPTCPALWLYEDWLATNAVDPEVGLPLLRSFVNDNIDKGGVSSTRLRMAAFSRRVTHGKFRHSGGDVWSLVPKYPNGLSAEEQRQVESIMRATWAVTNRTDSEDEAKALAWSTAFWTTCRKLTPCVPPNYERDVVLVDDENDGALDPEPLMRLSEMQRMLLELDRAGETLRERQREAFANPDRDEPNAVLLGMASRLFRLLYAFVERPSAWAPETVALHLRPLTETRIVSAWLMIRNDPALFQAYREHGLGHLKLLRDHIRADLGDDDLDAEAQEMIDHLDRRVNAERDEMFQNVNVGSFADASIRQMAVDADLKRLYDLSYVPFSSENHGEWPSVRDSDTVPCGEPLHGGHRMGAFGPPGRTVGPQPVVFAASLAEAGIRAIMTHCGIEIGDAFAPFQAALENALYDKSDEAED
jgi:Family of unknown function (DUF5677)